jgi:uncharacterized protein (DUF983 family)
MSEPTSEAAPVSPYVAGVMCRCPRCGRGSIFTSALSLSVRERCASCGFDLKFIDPGDGPAIFAIMIVGFLILGAALIVEFRFNPPVWVHVVLWGPATLAVAFGLLRPLKGLLVALQFHHMAEQVRPE